MKRAVLLACVAIFALSFLLPVALTFIGSLMSPAEAGEVFGNQSPSIRLIPHRLTLSQYYAVLFETSDYIVLFMRSAALSIGITLGTALVSVVCGYLFAKVRFRCREVLFFAYIVLMLLPFQVTLLPTYIFAKWLRVYDTWWAIAIPAAFAPFGVFLLRQFIVNMPDELSEAALLETKSPAVFLLHVIVPTVWPGIMALAVIQFSECWNMVEQPLILLETASNYPLALVLSRMTSDSGVAFSSVILYMVPIVLLFLLFDEQLIEGLGKIQQ